jgi:hypothetical protein
MAREDFPRQSSVTALSDAGQIALEASFIVESGASCISIRQTKGQYNVV